MHGGIITSGRFAHLRRGRLVLDELDQLVFVHHVARRHREVAADLERRLRRVWLMRRFCTSPSRLARPRVQALAVASRCASRSASGLVAGKFAGHIASIHCRAAKRARSLAFGVELGALRPAPRGSARRAGRTASDSRSRRCRAIPWPRSAGRRARARRASRACPKRARSRAGPASRSSRAAGERCSGKLAGGRGRAGHDSHPALRHLVARLRDRRKEGVRGAGLHRAPILRRTTQPVKCFLSP